MNQRKQNNILETLGDTAFMLLTGKFLVEQIRGYCKKYPSFKSEMINTLELLIQELKQKP
jgi:hypothetical protein